ncbi:MAG: hypothetical protein P8Z30_08380 [Acidobacteriota bacterium]
MIENVVISFQRNVNLCEEVEDESLEFVGFRFFEMAAAPFVKIPGGLPGIGAGRISCRATDCAQPAKTRCRIAREASGHGQA